MGVVRGVEVLLYLVPTFLHHKNGETSEKCFGEVAWCFLLRHPSDGRAQEATLGSANLSSKCTSGLSYLHSNTGVTLL